MGQLCPIWRMGHSSDCFLEVKSNGEADSAVVSPRAEIKAVVRNNPGSVVVLVSNRM